MNLHMWLIFITVLELSLNSSMLEKWSDFFCLFVYFLIIRYGLVLMLSNKPYLGRLAQMDRCLLEE